MPDKTDHLSEHLPWLLPTVLGMALAVVRRFRRSRSERFIVTLSRFISHVFTCIFAGYVTSGILTHLEFPKLVAPACALAGLYGTIVVDYLEDDGLGLFKQYFESLLGRRGASRRPAPKPPKPPKQKGGPDEN